MCLLQSPPSVFGGELRIRSKDMNSTQVHDDTAVRASNAARVDLKLEVVVITVSDVDRAKGFYEELGWRLDLDYAANKQYRVVQFTPPGSACSIIFGSGITPASLGSAHGLYLIVFDIEAALADLKDRGIEVSEPFYDVGGIFHHLDEEGVITGFQPQRKSYGTYASFKDPDGNNWFLQEVTARLPGHELSVDTEFTSSTELARALRRAEAAHREHEKRTGKPDEKWADWYADYISREQAGKPLPV
jgi:predicted enzyme related to lactoylglutathione lyase